MGNSQCISESTATDSTTEIVYKDGSKYRGTLSANGLREGIGKLVLANGDIFQGITNNIYIYIYIIGKWENNMKEGYGVMEWINKQMYEGMWKKNNFNGHGKLTYKNGNIFVGDWVEDKKQGHVCINIYISNIYRVN